MINKTSIIRKFKVSAKHRVRKKNTGHRKDKTLKLLLIPVILIAVLKLMFLYIYSDHHTIENAAFNLTPDVSAQEKSTIPENNSPAAEQPGAADVAENPDSGLSSPGEGKWDSGFLKELKIREDNIKRKQASLELQEQSLVKLKKQIEERLEELSAVEKNISKLLDQKEQVENEKIKKLAKVFEATPAEQAGALMSKLDVEIAADLLIHMNGRKAGKIWGYVNADRAVLISKRLSEIKPDFKIENRK